MVLVEVELHTKVKSQEMVVVVVVGCLRTIKSYLERARMRWVAGGLGT